MPKHQQPDDGKPQDRSQHETAEEDRAGAREDGEGVGEHRVRGLQGHQQHKDDDQRDREIVPDQGSAQRSGEPDDEDDEHEPQRQDRPPDQGDRPKELRPLTALLVDR